MNGHGGPAVIEVGAKTHRADSFRRRRDGARSRRFMAAGPGIILLATFLPWGTRFGHAVNGWQESRMILALGDAIASASLRWLALTWYGIPLAAAAMWLALWTHPTSTWTIRVLAALVVVLTAVSMFVHLRSGGGFRALSAATVCTTAVAIELQARRIRLATRSPMLRRRR